MPIFLLYLFLLLERFVSCRHEAVFSDDYADLRRRHLRLYAERRLFISPRC